MKDGKRELLSGKTWMGVLERYKYVLLVIFAGVLLLLWPESGEQPRESAGTAENIQAGESFDLAAVEEKLSAALSRIEGAGEVTVLLTVQNSGRNILAEDQTTSEGNGESERTAETVVISTGSGSQSPVLLQQVYPAFQGALVVCSGGDEAEIRLQLTAAVSALTGLGTDKICICKGK